MITHSGVSFASIELLPGLYVQADTAILGKAYRDTKQAWKWIYEKNLLIVRNELLLHTVSESAEVKGH